MCMRYIPGLSPSCKLPRACFRLCFRSGHPSCGLARASAVRGASITVRHETPVALLKQVRLREQGFTLFIVKLATDRGDNNPPGHPATSGVGVCQPILAPAFLISHGNCALNFLLAFA